MTLAKIDNTQVTQSFSLKDRVEHNWNHRKAEVITSWVTASALSSGVGAALLFGGPLSLIIGLAAATLFALGLFLKTVLSQPKNVTKIEQPVKKAAALPAPIAAKTSMSPVETTPSVETPKEAPIAEKQGVSQRFKNALTYAKEHPYQATLAAALVIGSIYAAYNVSSASKFLTLGTPADAVSNGTCPMRAKLPTQLALPMPMTGTAVAKILTAHAGKIFTVKLPSAPTLPTPAVVAGRITPKLPPFALAKPSATSSMPAIRPTFFFPPNTSNLTSNSTL